jgi:hypothetical protein
MLVTFSAHGGATTLTTFGQRDFLRSPSKRQRRTLQIPRFRKRSMVDRRHSAPFTVAEFETLSTWSTQDLNIGQVDPYPKICITTDNGFLSKDGYTGRGSAHGPLMSAVCLDASSQRQTIQPTDKQTSKQCFGINPAALLHPSSKSYNPPPPVGLQPSTNFSEGCIDPRVLSKSYKPERDDLAYCPILPQRQNTACKYQNSLQVLQRNAKFKKLTGLGRVVCLNRVLQFRSQSQTV